MRCPLNPRPGCAEKLSASARSPAPRTGAPPRGIQMIAFWDLGWCWCCTCAFWSHDQNHAGFWEMRTPDTINFMGPVKNCICLVLGGQTAGPHTVNLTNKETLAFYFSFSIHGALAIYVPFTFIDVLLLYFFHTIHTIFFILLLIIWQWHGSSQV